MRYGDQVVRTVEVVCVGDTESEAVPHRIAGCYQLPGTQRREIEK
jgi:hypothetical protein